MKKTIKIFVKADKEAPNIRNSCRTLRDARRNLQTTR